MQQILHFLVISKVHENEHKCTSQNVIIMNTLVQQKKNIDVLEVECNMLRNMVINLSKDSNFITSNHMMSTNYIQANLKEEDTIHERMEDMDLGNHNALPSNLKQEEANSHQVFR